MVSQQPLYLHVNASEHTRQLVDLRVRHILHSEHICEARYKYMNRLLLKLVAKQFYIHKITQGILK